MRIRLSGSLITSGLFQDVLISSRTLGVRLSTVKFVRRDGQIAHQPTTITMMLSPDQAPALDTGGGDGI